MANIDVRLPDPHNFNLDNDELKRYLNELVRALSAQTNLVKENLDSTTFLSSLTVDITTTGDITGNNLTGTNTGDEVSATDTVEGIIELATQAEVDTGTDTTRAVTPDTLSSYSGLGLTGSIVDFGGTSAPTGYLTCDGSAVSRTTYVALFTAISTTWGIGDGVTTFNLPNLQRTTTVGSGGTGTGSLANTVGSTGGSETHTLTTGEMPSHSHTISLGAAIGTSGRSASASGPQTSTTTTATQGSGTAHNILQPSAVVLKIIKT